MGTQESNSKGKQPGVVNGCGNKWYETLIGICLRNKDGQMVPGTDGKSAEDKAFGLEQIAPQTTEHTTTKRFAKYYTNTIGRRLEKEKEKG